MLLSCFPAVDAFGLLFDDLAGAFFLDGAFALALAEPDFLLAVYLTFVIGGVKASGGGLGESENPVSHQ